MTARDHCPTCRHRHQRGPTGRLVCGGDDGTCKCDPADPCRCGVCEMARASRTARKPSAGWECLTSDVWVLRASPILATAQRPMGSGDASWYATNNVGSSVNGYLIWQSTGWGMSLAAAQLAAEAALLAIAAEIVGAVGR